MTRVAGLFVRPCLGTLGCCGRQYYKKDLLLGKKDTGETEVVPFPKDVRDGIGDVWGECTIGRLVPPNRTTVFGDLRMIIFMGILNLVTI